MVEHLNKTKLEYENQTAYHSAYSGAMMLTKICDYINGALEDGDFVIGISIDQSSFFSLIPQDKLHNKFQSWYNIRDDALTVLREYVTGRKAEFPAKAQ